MVEMDRAQLIAAYEDAHNIPEINRYTEYAETYKCYMIKIGIGAEFIEKRFNQALEEKKINERANPDMLYVLEITLDHNFKDIAKFALNNVDRMLEEFYFSNKQERRIGVKTLTEDVVYILGIREGYERFDILNKERLDFFDIRMDLLNKLQEIKNKDLMENTKNLLAKADSYLSRKQPKFNYDKEIKKRMKVNKKVFVNERMEDYDFRTIDLSDALFLNCYLKNANFAHVNLQNCIFVNCDLESAVFIGAVLNNAYIIDGELSSVEDIYKDYV